MSYRIIVVNSEGAGWSGSSLFTLGKCWYLPSGNDYTFRGVRVSIILPPFWKGVCPKRKGFAPQEKQILSFWPLFWRELVYRRANRKSQELSFMYKMAENLPVYQVRVNPQLKFKVNTLTNLHRCAAFMLYMPACLGLHHLFIMQSGGFALNVPYHN